MASKKTLPADAPNTVYTVLSVVIHDGVRHEVGDSIELSDAAAAPLLAARAVAAEAQAAPE